MTNLLQLPQYFDLEIYTTGRLEKVSHTSDKLKIYIKKKNFKNHKKIGFLLLAIILTRELLSLSLNVAPGVPSASDQGNSGEAH